MKEIMVLVDNSLLLCNPVVKFNRFSETYELSGRVVNGEWDYLQKDGFEMSLCQRFYKKLKPHDYFIYIEHPYSDYNLAFEENVAKEKVNLKVLKSRLEKQIKDNLKFKYTPGHDLYEGDDDILF